jgi:hypothetical protein
MDEHAACGTGTIDFSAVLDSVSPRTTAVIEVQDLGAVRPGLAYLNGM